ncbi:MAG: hypothetical protein JSW41_00015 [Candidatus Aenigmatarchaeota archaeon]|nr:MAG: hypothetical protein JSW41_00015 [Candidatus Aenigmarchaeota archaeon]
MTAKYRDSYHFIEVFEGWAKRETPESQLEMLKTYRMSFERGEIEMADPERAREYVDKRIQEFEKSLNPAET